MKNDKHDKLIRDWARLGCLFGVAPTARTPDLERLLLRTAAALPDDARLLPVVVTWIVRFGDAIARHRLARLIREELAPADQPALGFLLETAIEHGAPARLSVCIQACQPAEEPGPLFTVHGVSPSLGEVARRNASDIASRWGLWGPLVNLKRDSIRPVRWVLKQNPGLRDRLIRKGDLRVSVIESLRRDTRNGSTPSELAITRLVGGSRLAVKQAIGALELEGAIVIGADPSNDRDHPVRLVAA